jgi:hypothetical protein
MDALRLREALQSALDALTTVPGVNDGLGDAQGQGDGQGDAQGDAQGRGDDANDQGLVHNDDNPPPIPNPPEGGIIDPNGVQRPAASCDELLEHLNTFAKQNGFAVIKKNGSNKCKATGEYRYYTLQCDRDAVRPSEGHGLRRGVTMKQGCQWKGIASRPAAVDAGWS